MSSSMSGASRLALLALLVLSVSGAGCYRPEPAEGSFRCSPDLGGLCPSGMICGAQNLCIKPSSTDLGTQPLDLAGDLAAAPVKRSCEDRVSQGAFSNLKVLTALNTAADEEHLALGPTSATPALLFQRGTQLFSAAIAASDGKSVSAPVAVALTGGPVGLVAHGGSFGSDGSYWFAGTAAGSTSLYQATRVDASHFTVAASHAPVAAACAFSDPFLMQGDPTKELYLAFPLAGCAGESYVATGAVDRNLGALYSSLPEAGWAAPSLTKSGLLLLTSSTVGGRHLYAAARSAAQYQFANASRVWMAAGTTAMPGIGEAMEDRQAVVSSDCRTIYFSSVRTGGAGGADLYAADIVAE